MSKPLSPAAQAILEKVNAAPHCGSGRVKAAAALRELAIRINGADVIRQDVLDIAEELEAS